MKILTHTGGICATNTYLLLDEAAKVGAIVDAPDHTLAPLLEAAKKQGVAITHLLFTHGHFDHIADHAAVTAAFPQAQVLIHRLEEPRLIKPDAMLFELPFVIPPRRADGYLEDGQSLKVGNIEVRVLHTPGHAVGHVCFHLPEEKVLFAGDLIMAGSIGRTDFEDGDTAQMRESLRRIMELPGETVILSGHGPATTVARERRENPFLLDWGIGQ